MKDLEQVRQNEKSRPLLVKKIIGRWCPQSRYNRLIGGMIPQEVYYWVRWVPESKLENCADLVAMFNSSHPIESYPKCFYWTGFGDTIMIDLDSEKTVHFDQEDDPEDALYGFEPRIRRIRIQTLPSSS